MTLGNEDHKSIWRAMERLVDQGKARAIGVSNFNSAQCEAIAEYARVPIAVNQVELNSYWQQKNLRKTMDTLGIKLMAYAPLGSPGKYIVSS